MNNGNNQSSSDRLKALRDKYGELLTLEEIAEALKYRNVAAVRKAHSRGTLPVELKRFPHRRGWFATVEAVAQCIENLSRND